MRLHSLMIACAMASTFAPSSHVDARALEVEEANTLTTQEVQANLADSHPSVFYVFAKRLYADDRRDEAVKWYYVGQIRYRFFLKANPGLPEDDDPAIAAAVEEMLGRTITPWAGGDPYRWAASIDEALDWDARHPNALTNKVAHGRALDEVRTSMVVMRNEILANVEQIRAARRKVGKENR